MASTRQLSSILRAVNFVGRGLARLGLEPGLLEVEACLARARAQTGFDDFGGEEFLAPFELLTGDIRDMGAELNTVGRLGLSRDFVRSLTNRLRTREAIRRHPEILAESIVQPIFIVGSPRTGTTMLHNLLSRLPGAVAPLFWQLLEPAPHLDRGELRGGVDPRERAAQQMEKEIDRVLPQVQMVHPMRWNWPEECLWLFTNSFMSELYLARFALPNYRRLLMQGDWSWAVAEYREALQLLQWQRGAPTQWILKAPGHMFRLEALAVAFPDARFIRTHRTPLETVASMCSLFEYGHLPANRSFDLRGVGDEVMRSWVDVGLDRLVDFAATDASERSVDLDFRALMRAPFEEIERMWAALGLELGDQAPMRAWLETNPRHSKGRHVYELARYGLSEAEVLGRTRRYRECFADYLS